MATVVFDLGGVLVENVTLGALASLLPQPADVETVRTRWLASDSVRSFELGRISSEEFAARFLSEWHLELSPNEFLAQFDTWPRAFWPASLELLAELRARHTVACLTNCNERHWRRFGGFTEEFDAAFSSHLIGRIKPDRDVFELVLDRLGCPPGETWYFDDSPACIDAALGLGMRAHLADGPEACRVILSAEGLCEARA